MKSSTFYCVCGGVTYWPGDVTTCVHCDRALRNRAIGKTYFTESSDPIAKKPATPPARPVRVGDVVRHKTSYISGNVTGIRDNDGRPSLHVQTSEDSWHADYADQHRHADGAPIDVEATLAELRNASTFRGLGHASIFDDGMFVEARAPQHEAINGLVVPAAELDAARKRIAELEAQVEWAKSTLATFQDRAGRATDDAGALRTELTQVKAELCDALRKLERAERKVKR